MRAADLFIGEREVTYLDPNRKYYLESGYQLIHFKIWRLLFNGMEVLNETHTKFWDIVDLYPKKTYEIQDTIEERVEPWREQEVVHDSHESDRYRQFLRRYGI